MNEKRETKRNKEGVALCIKWKEEEDEVKKGWGNVVGKELGKEKENKGGAEVSCDTHMRWWKR